MRTSQLSYILPEEEEEAKDIIRESFGHELPKVFGNQMAVKIYVRDEDIVLTKIDGKEVKICIPSMVAINDKYRSCAALVLNQGPDCYKSDRFKNSGPWCKVGDWICIPRNEGVQFNYRDVAVQIIDEDKVFCVIEDPTHIYKYLGG